MSRLLGGEGPALRGGDTCSVVSLLATFMSFIVNVFGVGLVINKFTQSRPKIKISDVGIIKQRDGTFVFQTRYISLNGHLLTNCTAKMSSYIKR